MQIKNLSKTFYNSLCFLWLCSAIVVNAQLKYELHRITSAEKDPQDNLEEENDLQDNSIPLKVAIANQYIITIDAGENKDQEFNIQFQLGGNQFWLASEECSISDLGSNKYVCSEKTCDKTQTGQFYDEERSVMEGYYATDVITLPNDISTSFSFLSIISSTEYSSQYLGLDGAIQFGSNKTTSIVNKLFNEKKIPKNVFSLKLNYNAIVTMMGVIYPDSELIIGGYNNKIVTDGEQIHYYNVIDSNMWAVEIKAASSNNKKVLTDKRKAFLKLGTPTIMIPQYEFEIFKDSLEAFLDNCEVLEDTYIFCRSCEYYSFIEDHPPFKMTFIDSNKKQQTIYIPPKDYIQQSQGQCTYLIQQNNLEFSDKTVMTAKDWVLGDIFLKQIYSIYNYENNTIGFIQLEAHQPEDYKSSTLYVVLLIVFAVIAVGVGIYAYLVWKQKKLLQEQEEQKRQGLLEGDQIQMDNFGPMN